LIIETLKISVMKKKEKHLEYNHHIRHQFQCFLIKLIKKKRGNFFYFYFFLKKVAILIQLFKEKEKRPQINNYKN
jgi:hypothetical protein